MSFNPDPTKQTQEVIFSQKMIKPSHPLIKLNNLPVQNASSQKNLGMILDGKLNFESHLKEKCLKFNKSISVIKKLQNILLRQALLTIYKSFVRPHLDYGGIIYDQPKNKSFLSKTRILSMQCSFRYNRSNNRYKHLKLKFIRNWVLNL